MLSAKYQMFLIMLLNKTLTKNDCELFKTRKSFYTMTAFLQKKDLVGSSIIDERGRKEYELTIRGEILALALENILTDNETKRIKSYIRCFA